MNKAVSDSTLRDGAARLLRVRTAYEKSLTLRSGPQGRVSKGEARRMASTGVAFTAALALAACAADGGGMSSNFGFGSVATDSISPYYTPSTVTYAAQRGTIPVVIIGNPFTGPEQPVDVAIRDALRMPGWAPNARFVPDANADAGKGHRVVLVLNPANPNLNPNALCGTDPVATVSGGPFMVRAAFCQDALPLSSASVRRTAPSGPADPTFTQAAAQAVSLIFPFAEPRTISVQ